MAGWIFFLVGTKRICGVFYVGCPASEVASPCKLQDFPQSDIDFLWGPSAVAESLSVQCAPAVMPTFEQVLLLDMQGIAGVFTVAPLLVNKVAVAASLAF